MSEISLLSFLKIYSNVMFYLTITVHTDAVHSLCVQMVIELMSGIMNAGHL
jgi:hypothetical protein